MLNDITRQIIGSALRIHAKLGPGLREKVYESILFRDLKRSGLMVQRQEWVPVEFEGLKFEKAFRADLIVDARVSE